MYPDGKTIEHGERQGDAVSWDRARIDKLQLERLEHHAQNGQGFARCELLTRASAWTHIESNKLA